MPETCIGAQLYTVRDFLQTPQDIALSLKKIREIGYKAVQLSALGPIETSELKKILDSEGLIVAATHIPFNKMKNETQQVIDDHLLLGCKYPAIGSMPGDYPRTAEGFAAFAKDANEVAAKLAEAGLVFGYHNHSFELEKFDGKTGLDIIMQETDSRLVTMEIDTYWIQHGGGDPAAWIRKCSGRIPLLHCKDMAVKDKTQLMAEVGEGNLNWGAILEAAKAAGVVWYLVEQDTCQRDPFESLEISLRNLKVMGLS